MVGRGQLLILPVWPRARAGDGACPPVGNYRTLSGWLGPTARELGAMTGDGIRYAGENRRCVAMPLGGIGTGNVALSGTGLLKQWQLHNTGNHLGFLPQTFFGLRLSCVEPPLSIRRVLQAPPLGPGSNPAPLVNDHLDAPGGYQPSFGWPFVRSTQFSGAYPFARIGYEDDWPVQVSLEAYTPFVPLDAEASSLPMASFRFTISNEFTHDLTGWLLGSLQNAVGWDGATPFSGPDCAMLGGNINQAESIAAGTAVVMTNPTTPDRDRGAGSDAHLDRITGRNAAPVRPDRDCARVRGLAEAARADRVRGLEPGVPGPVGCSPAAAVPQPGPAHRARAGPGPAAWPSPSTCRQAARRRLSW